MLFDNNISEGQSGHKIHVIDFMDKSAKVRIDKWLWAVRAYKTRSAAKNACDAGKVKVEQKCAKPSRDIVVGETVQFRKSGSTKIYKVLLLIEKRVSASLARECYEDLSPEEVKIKKAPTAFVDFPVREKGAGRPTKKERRGIDKLNDDVF